MFANFVPKMLKRLVLNLQKMLILGDCTQLIQNCLGPIGTERKWTKRLKKKDNQQKIFAFISTFAERSLKINRGITTHRKNQLSIKGKVDVFLT